jgi:type II secretory pathway component GspD/PulD (secretin)
MSTLLSRWIFSLATGFQLAAGAQDAVAPAEAPPNAQPSQSPPAALSSSGLPALSDEGYWIDNAPINEVFQYLARSAGLQFFHNNELSAPQFNVTGHLKVEDPRQQMEDLAIVYGLTVYQQRNSVSLLTDTQLARLPLEVMSYQLKYLRGAALNRSTVTSGDLSGMAGGGMGGAAMGGAGMAGGGMGGVGQPDFEKLKSIIRPMLTREVGQIEFEEKTNTLLVTDNSVKLERVRALLTELDRPKQQILINVRVLRIRRNEARQVGIDWSQALGDVGTTISMQQSLNALFNLPDTYQIARTGDPSNSTASLNKLNQEGVGLVFGNTQVQAILRALEEADIVSQEAAPTLITEDNEQGTISVVDRFPVITANVSSTTAGQNISEEVRYQIDEKDPDPSTNPERSREIGVTLTVTPTLLPDGTVRMKLRPRVAKIVELVAGRGSNGTAGNVYPRVSESTIEAISRVPAGRSLFLGGFYDYNNNEGNNKIPLLGSLPGFGRLFGSEKKKLEQVSLVFVITPQVYDASMEGEIEQMNQRVGGYSAMPAEAGGALAPLLPEPGWKSPSKTTVPEPAPSQQSWLRRLFGSRPAGGASPTQAGKPTGRATLR